MRLAGITLAISAALAFTAAARADDKADLMRAVGAAGMVNLQRQMMARFDTNRDGRLDDAEKAKAAAEIQKQLAALDKNGNGKLDPEEAALAKAMMSRSGQGGGPQFGAGGGGFGGAGGVGGGTAGGGFGGAADGAAGAPEPKKTRKQRLLEKLDQNGDGKVTKEEREAAAAERKAEQEALKAEKKAELERKKAEREAEAAADEK